jgi:hypothetical protein
MPTQFTREPSKIPLGCLYVCDLLLVLRAHNDCRIITEYGAIEHARSIEFSYSGLRLLIGQVTVKLFLEPKHEIEEP